MTSITGHESMPYEALLVIAGLLFNFIIVKMRGPNKSLNHKKTVVDGFFSPRTKFHKSYFF